MRGTNAGADLCVSVAMCALASVSVGLVERYALAALKKVVS
jgi:hypothetical protein